MRLRALRRYRCSVTDTSAAAEDTRPAPPVPEHKHRDITGGVARAMVFGANDGLVSNVSLILGVAGANPGAGYVRLAGVAGLIAGAVSMAAGSAAASAKLSDGGIGA